MRTMFKSYYKKGIWNGSCDGKFSSVTQSCLTLCDPMDCSMPGFPVHHQLLGLLKPSSRSCHPTISSSVVPFSSSLQSFPASGSFPMSQFFASGGQCIGVSASASVLLMNIQDWLPLGLAGLISLQCGSLIQSVPSCWGSLMTVVDSDSQRQCYKSPETTWALSSSMVASALCCGSCSTFSIKDSPF